MNTITNNFFTLVSKEETRDLTAATTENMPADFHQTKPFTSADMWNLQRRSRTMLQRRRNA